MIQLTSPLIEKSIRADERRKVLEQVEAIIRENLQLEGYKVTKSRVAMITDRIQELKGGIDK